MSTAAEGAAANQLYDVSANWFQVPTGQFRAAHAPPTLHKMPRRTTEALSLAMSLDSKLRNPNGTEILRRAGKGRCVAAGDGVS